LSIVYVRFDVMIPGWELTREGGGDGAVEEGGGNGGIRGCVCRNERCVMCVCVDLRLRGVM